ncbi:MAG: GIY-YIG nuclease family protein [Desulfobacterales bacterium]
MGAEALRVYCLYLKNDITKRIGEMQTCTPYKLKILSYKKGMTASQARATEKKLHRMHKYQQILNEWYEPEVYEEIKNILEGQKIL